MAAPYTTPPDSKIYSASVVKTPPEVESFRTRSFRFQAAKAAGRGEDSRSRSKGQIAVQWPQRIHLSKSIAG